MKTIEQKAKAYDEALKWMRELYPGLHGATKEDAERYFSELRESEDERIRKGLVNFLQSPFIKENLTDEKVAPWLAYLEKQKENPKSTDSIPLDCTSDAKCEDRWHKVGDSLPDNPREVLCKDEAGNYFIGRYYVGEGWEISNYDDEDKPHHLNPPVSKWIDFPLEKQKEPLPIPDKFNGLKSLMLQYLQSAANRKDDSEIESDTDLWGRKILDYVWKYSDEQKEQKEIPLMNGDADLYFDNWIQHNDATKRVCFEEGIRYAQRLQKEQKPAEWSKEDERKYYQLEYSMKAAGSIPAHLIQWALKSLRPSWKPSEEQVDAVRYFVNKHQSEAWAATGQWKEFAALRELLGILEKLM